MSEAPSLTDGKKPANPLPERLSDASDGLNRGKVGVARKMRSKVEQEQIIKRALSMSSEAGSKLTDDNGDGPDITEGRIIAVLICSKVLEADIWFALDDSFVPGDGQAVFYPDELQFLKDKDAETLRKNHKVKLAFPGSRVRQ